MAKIISSYYNRIPLVINGRKVHKPHKNYISDVKCSAIEIPDDICLQIISDTDLYTETIYSKDNPDKNFFKTKCISRSKMPSVIKKCDDVISDLCYSFKEYCAAHNRDTVLRVIESLSYVRTLIYNVYKTGGNYYLEVVKDY